MRTMLLGICTGSVVVGWTTPLERCVTELRLPMYPPIARQARITGTAVVTIRPGHRDRGAEVLVRGVPAILANEVRRSIALSHLKTSCGLDEITYRITFKIEGAANDMAVDTSVAFRPPTDFVIITTPAATQP
jgi:hypothetical protein